MPTPKCPFTPDDAKPIGSQWLCANFHTHTPGSSDYLKAQRPTTDGPSGSGKLTPVDVARAILQECVAQGIRVLGVTDHNSPSFQLRPSGNTGGLIADPERESYYALLRRVQREEGGELADVLVLPGVEVGAENIHVLGIFPPSPEPGADVLKIAGLLDQGGCPLDLYGNAQTSCTEYSISDAIDAIDARGGIAIPAHVDEDNGFLKEHKQPRLLSMILSRPHLFALEYVNDAIRSKLLEAMKSKDVARRMGSEIAWTKASDSHFTTALDRGGATKVNGKPLGTEYRRTYLKLDPSSLNFNFNAVRAALRDPQNRVRVDQTSHPFLRQGAIPSLGESHTRVRALRLKYKKSEETLHFSEGLTTLLGPSEAGKTTRLNAFRLVNGRLKSMSIVNGEREPVVVKEVDMLLEVLQPRENSRFWWIHRSTNDKVRATLCENDGESLVPDFQHSVTTILNPGNMDSRRYALSTDLRNACKQWGISPAPNIPTLYELNEMAEMLASPARTARFIEWHYAPIEIQKEHEKLHQELRELFRSRATISRKALASRLLKIFKNLDPIREAAAEALNTLFQDMKIGLVATRTRGAWSQNSSDVTIPVAESVQNCVQDDEKLFFDCLAPIEDQVTLTLRGLDPADLSETLSVALKGILLVTGARGLGPVIVDAPEAYFNPAELVEALAPAILQAKDQAASSSWR